MQNPGADGRYDEDYFLRGKETGKSLYKDYRWLPDLTVPMCERIAEHCEMEITDRVLDFGCARGYSVKAFRILGFDSWGVDVSEWAISNADPEVREYVSLGWPAGQMDWIIAKDVLEHIPTHSIEQVVEQLFQARKGIFVVVPLGHRDSPNDKWRYVVPEYEADVTHVVRWSLDAWVKLFLKHMPAGWEISASYRIKGIKDNYSQWEKGNGFITLRKI